MSSSFLFLKKSTAKFKHFSQFKITHINTWKHVKSYDNQNYCSQTLNRFVGFFFKELDLPLLWTFFKFFSAQLKNLGNEWKNIGHVYVYVPPNCTSKLQTMDLSVQKTIKIICEINLKHGTQRKWHPFSKPVMILKLT